MAELRQEIKSAFAREKNPAVEGFAVSETMRWKEPVVAKMDQGWAAEPKARPATLGRIGLEYVGIDLMPAEDV